jgi:hypothetical protein
VEIPLSSFGSSLSFSPTLSLFLINAYYHITHQKKRSVTSQRVQLRQRESERCIAVELSFVPHPFPILSDRQRTSVVINTPHRETQRVCGVDAMLKREKEREMGVNVAFPLRRSLSAFSRFSRVSPLFLYLANRLVLTVGCTLYFGMKEG